MFQMPLWVPIIIMGSTTTTEISLQDQSCIAGINLSFDVCRYAKEIAVRLFRHGCICSQNCLVRIQLKCFECLHLVLLNRLLMIFINFLHYFVVGKIVFWITVVSTHASCNCFEQLTQNSDADHLLSHINHNDYFQVQVASKGAAARGAP